MTGNLQTPLTYLVCGSRWALLVGLSRFHLPLRVLLRWDNQNYIGRECFVDDEGEQASFVMA